MVSSDWDAETLPMDASHGQGAWVRGLRVLAAITTRTWLQFYHRLAIEGRDNLPTVGSFILVANHSSHLDTLCLMSALAIHRVEHTYPIAARDYFCVNPLRAFLAKTFANVQPLDRHSMCSGSLGLCARMLRTPGTILVLFPEGTRTHRAELGEFKPGVGLLAAGHEYPVVPCYLFGTRDALPKGRWLPRPSEIRLRIGEPRIYSHLPPTKDSRIKVCCDLREAVAKLGRL